MRPPSPTDASAARPREDEPCGQTRKQRSVLPGAHVQPSQERQEAQDRLHRGFARTRRSNDSRHGFASRPYRATARSALRERADRSVWMEGRRAHLRPFHQFGAPIPMKPPRAASTSRRPLAANRQAAFELLSRLRRPRPELYAATGALSLRRAWRSLSLDCVPAAAYSDARQLFAGQARIVVQGPLLSRQLVDPPVSATARAGGRARATRGRT
jgi:hypothetical protein